MRTALVTGATGGIGFQATCQLAEAGLHVVLTGRDRVKGEAALAELCRLHPGSSADFRLLDVASQRGIADFAAAWTGPLGILLNNAGVMGYDPRRVTGDGFEAQFGTNHLGHFALTLRLLPSLLAEPGARVVTVASLAHRRARIEFDDLQGERQYRAFTAYGQSKLANLMFSLELARRAGAAGWPLAAIAAHPGWSATRIVTNGFGAGLKGRASQLVFNALGQSAAFGALPLVYAALDPRAQSGGYYGPAHLMETRGPVAPARIMPQAQDEAAAARLWSVSEALTRVRLADFAATS